MEVFHDTDIGSLLKVEDGIPVSHIPFWTSEIYGFGRYIRQYGFYPKRLPLFVFTDHSGPSIIETFNYFELSHDAPFTLLHNPTLVEKFKKLTGRPCYVLYSPFVFYRRQHGITQMKNATGTLAYPAHSLPSLADDLDLTEYMEQLVRLPEQYQPVSVSLHYHDLEKGVHRNFLDHGFRVYTAGNPLDYKFTERFYAILRHFKYSTSNLPGSYLFYAVEMGIPFFLHGQRPNYRMTDNSRVAEEAYKCATTRDKLLGTYEEAFSIMASSVSSRQNSLVSHTLGLGHGISRRRMAWILYFSFLKAQFYRVRNYLLRLLSSLRQNYEVSE